MQQVKLWQYENVFWCGVLGSFFFFNNTAMPLALMMLVAPPMFNMGHGACLTSGLQELCLLQFCTIT